MPNILGGGMNIILVSSRLAKTRSITLGGWQLLFMLLLLSGLVWAAALRNVGDSFGLGVRGKPSGRLELGADLSPSDINDEYGQQRLNAASPATVVAPLPEVSTKLTRLTLFAKYAVQKNAGVRLDYIYDRFSTDDFTWTTWQYVVGTRVLPDPRQKVDFIGVSGYYRFQ